MCRALRMMLKRFAEKAGSSGLWEAFVGKEGRTETEMPIELRRLLFSRSQRLEGTLHYFYPLRLSNPL